MDTLATLEPNVWDKKKYEDVLKETKVDDMVPSIVPFSKTANIASDIINKHFKVFHYYSTNIWPIY